MSNFLKSLKDSQPERLSKTYPYTVAEWENKVINLRRLTAADQKTAVQWAKKYSRQNEALGVGVAIICLSVNDPEILPLIPETLEVLQGEPAEAVAGIINEIKKISGLGEE